MVPQDADTKAGPGTLGRRTRPSGDKCSSMPITNTSPSIPAIVTIPPPRNHPTNPRQFDASDPPNVSPFALFASGADRTGGCAQSNRVSGLKLGRIWSS
jgi:hypothetical protein